MMRQETAEILDAENIQSASWLSGFRISPLHFFPLHLLSQIDRNPLELRATDFEGGDFARKFGRVFQPVGLRLELRGVADGFTSRRIRHGAKAHRTPLATGERHKLDRWSRDANEILGMSVEHIRRQFPGRRIADEFEIVRMVTNFNERPTVRCTMRMAPATRRRLWPGTRAQRYEEEAGEDSREREFHAT